MRRSSATVVLLLLALQGCAPTTSPVVTDPAAPPATSQGAASTGAGGEQSVSDEDVGCPGHPAWADSDRPFTEATLHEDASDDYHPDAAVHGVAPTAVAGACAVAALGELRTACPDTVMDLVPDWDRMEREGVGGDWPDPAEEVEGSRLYGDVLLDHALVSEETRRVDGHRQRVVTVTVGEVRWESPDADGEPPTPGSTIDVRVFDRCPVPESGSLLLPYLSREDGDVEWWATLITDDEGRPTSASSHGTALMLYDLSWWAGPDHDRRDLVVAAVEGGWERSRVESASGCDGYEVVCPVPDDLMGRWRLARGWATDPDGPSPSVQAASEAVTRFVEAPWTERFLSDMEVDLVPGVDEAMGFTWTWYEVLIRPQDQSRLDVDWLSLQFPGFGRCGVLQVNHGDTFPTELWCWGPDSGPVSVVGYRGEQPVEAGRVEIVTWEQWPSTSTSVTLQVAEDGTVAP